MERLMTEQRTTVVAVLFALLGIMVLLWFIRGPEPNWANLSFFVVSTLLVPLACYAVYGLFYLVARTNAAPNRALRLACGCLFTVGALYLAWSVVFAVYDFATHRSVPSPSLFSLGVALGALKAWGLQASGRDAA